MMNTFVAVPGGWELVLIVLVILLLFGAKKLPELARGSGRALRIFKAETKGLVDDDDVDESDKTPEQRELEARNQQPEPPLTETDDPAHPIVRDPRDGQAS
jgi:sec-independent protein translocase protein TatA